jgi:hypothetical protein
VPRHDGPFRSASAIGRIIVNGSFVTAKSAPNDVDVVLLPGADYPRGEEPIDVKRKRLWPFLQIFIAAEEEDLEAWATQDFGTDRLQRPKGVVEVIR